MQQQLSALDNIRWDADDTCPKCGGRVYMAEYREHWAVCKTVKLPLNMKIGDLPKTTSRAKRERRQRATTP